MQRLIATLCIAALSGTGLAACGSSNDNSTSTDASGGAKSGTVGAPGATVKFIAPKDGSTTGSTVVARVKITGFKLDPAAVGKKAKQGEGHLHFSMDNGKFDTPKYSGANGKLAVQLGVDGQYSPATAPTITYKNLPPGKHELKVYLANNDHTNTGVEQVTTFTVK